MLKNSFKIFKKNKKRILTTWLIFWFVFFLPELIIISIPFGISLGIINFQDFVRFIPLINSLILHQKIFQIILGYPLSIR